MLIYLFDARATQFKSEHLLVFLIFNISYLSNQIGGAIPLGKRGKLKPAHVGQFGLSLGLKPDWLIRAS